MRDIVERKRWPPGCMRESKLSASGLIIETAWCGILTLTSSAQERRKSAGLSTCSITSIEHTTSKRCGSLTKVSAAVCLYVNEPREGSAGRDKVGSAAECRDAIAMFFSDASIASARAPSRAKL